MRLILASSSPRRLELLRAAGIGFEVMAPGLEEVLVAGEGPEAAVRRLAEEKARAVMGRVAGEAVVLAADTAVVLEGRMLGKPGSVEEAGEMLRSLSGRTHEVMTGFALGRGGRVRSAVCVTRVAFRVLGEEEIGAYVATGEPMDKAGGYGIQSGAAHMVRSVWGSYTNVVGLPVAEVVEGLREFLLAVE